jgi:hypothetical protein
MNKILPLTLPLACLCLFSSCDIATPENYFDRAVLNCNQMQGFADTGLQRQMASPSVRLSDGKTGETVTMTRREIMDDKISSLQSAFDRVKKLRETDDAREMLQASRALYAYVLPVYEGEYRQLAKLYDEGADNGKIAVMEQTIHTKYRPKFESLFDQLIAVAKPYAARHNIRVKWDIRTSPSQ